MNVFVQKKTVAIVQARMSSTRLPGKVLLPLAGYEVLFHIWERLSRVSNLDKIVIATTDDETDHPIVEFCHQNKLDVFAYDGPADDLLSRYIACGQLYEADIIVMVDGDCPLLHPPTVERMVQALVEHSEAEYCKLDERSIEGGVAVLRLTTYLKMAQFANEPYHREHATIFLLENPHRFSIVEIPCEDEFRDKKHRLWLDTPADYRFLTEVYNRLYLPGNVVDLHEVVRLLHTDEALRSINAHVTQKDIRENVSPLVVIPEELDKKHLQKAWEIISLLTECFHAGVRVFRQNLSPIEQNWWLARNVLVSEQPPQPDEVVLTLDASPEHFHPLPPSHNGTPRMKIGLSNQKLMTDLAMWVACYSGYQSGQSAYVKVTQRSSQDGSHLETSPCPLCGSQHWESVWMHKSGITHGICLECGHVYLMRKLSQSAIEASYREYKQNYSDEYLRSPSNALFEAVRNCYQILQAYLPHQFRNILEIGCAYGHFLSLIPLPCFRVGIEPSREQASFARKYLDIAEIWECAYEQLSTIPPTWPKEGFDIVCSFHVLEHTKEPDKFLQFVRRIIREDGYLCLAVPNLFSLPPNLLELFYIYRSWHLHTFSPEILSRLLTKEGFKVIDIIEEKSAPMHRSNLVAIARSESSTSVGKVSQESIEASRHTLMKFHKMLDIQIQKVEQAFTSWAALNKRVAIYGGGIHTQALLELSGISPDQIHVIIDDDPAKQGQSLYGIEIHNFQQALNLGADVIVVSSLASEDVILERLKKTAPNSIEVVGIYRDIMKNHLTVSNQ